MSDPTCTIHIGDVRAVLKTLPSESVHCVVTSPPYWALRDYGVAGQIGSEATLDEWVATMVDVFREVRRVMRPDGTLWLNLGDSYASGGGSGVQGAGGQMADRSVAKGRTRGKKASDTGLKPKDLCGQPWRVAFALQADGWYLRSDCIWHKPAPMPSSVTDRPTTAHEYMFLLAKSPRYFYDGEAIREAAKDWSAGGPGTGIKPTFHYHADNGGNAGLSALASKYKDGNAPTTRNARTVWTIGPDPQKHDPDDANHYAAYPPALVEPCVKAGTSRKGCCAKCGAPWGRVSEPTKEYAAWLGRGFHDHQDDGVKGQRRDNKRCPAISKATVTTGWSPSCACAADVTPCTVFDPFSGTGTTGVVALAYGCNYVGIELNPAYAEKSRRRIAQDVPHLAHAVGAKEKKALPLFDTEMMREASK